MSNYNYNFDFSPNGGNNNNNKNRKNDEGGDWISWALIAILFATGAWFIALPMLFIKLFAPDDKRERSSSSLGSMASNVASNVASTVSATAKAAADRAAAAGRGGEAKRDSKARDAAKNAMRSPVMKSSTAKLLRIIGIAAAALGVFLLIDPVSSILAGLTGSYYIQQLLRAISIIIGGTGTFIGGLAMTNAMKRYAKYMAVIGSADSMSIESIARKVGRSKKRAARDLQKMIEKGYLGDTAYINMETGYFFRSGEADAELTALRAAAMKKAAEADKQTASDTYSQILAGIRAANDRIADPVLSEKISRIEGITAAIFRAVQEHPSKRGQIDTFMNYYLPTTQKLLDSYAEFDGAGVEVALVESSSWTRSTKTTPWTWTAT